MMDKEKQVCACVCVCVCMRDAAILVYLKMFHFPQPYTEKAALINQLRFSRKKNKKT